MVDSDEDEKYNEQQAQAIRQTKQGLRQDEQGLRQDYGQEQQELTERVTKEHTEQLIEVENRQNQSDLHLVRIIDGVDYLSAQVTTLNERVYSKNYLDKIRNALIIGSIVVFIFVSGILGVLLINQKHSAEDRAREAELGRRQIADCTVKPGVVLDKDYVNPGKCYIESAERTGAAVNKITTDIIQAMKEMFITSSSNP